MTISVDGLAVGTYNYTIVATDGLGGSVQDTVIVSVTPTVPSAPQNLQAVAGSGKVSLSWTAPFLQAWTILDICPGCPN